MMTKSTVVMWHHGVTLTDPIITETQQHFVEEGKSTRQTTDFIHRLLGKWFFQFCYAYSTFRYRLPRGHNTLLHLATTSETREWQIQTIKHPCAYIHICTRSIRKSIESGNNLLLLQWVAYNPQWLSCGTDSRMPAWHWANFHYANRRHNVHTNGYG